MPWIKFWSGTYENDRDNVQYAWYDAAPPDEILEDEAHERVPTWLRLSGLYSWGHDVVDTLPDDVRTELLQGFKRKRAYAEKMIELLKVTDVMEG